MKGGCNARRSTMVWAVLTAQLNRILMDAIELAPMKPPPHVVGSGLEPSLCSKTP